MDELKTYFEAKWEIERELSESNDAIHRRMLRVALHELVTEAEKKFTADELLFGWLLLLETVQD